MKTYREYIIQFILFSYLFLWPSQANPAGEISEDEVKAAYIYRIIKFVEWPESILPKGRGALTVCLFGEDPIEKVLEPIKKLKAQGHAIRLERLGSMQSDRVCHVLFIGDKEEHHLKEILHLIKHLSMLTVSDIESFVSKGGMIGFVLKSGRVQLEINVEASRKAKIKLSSDLLEVATLLKVTRP